MPFENDTPFPEHAAGPHPLIHSIGHWALGALLHAALGLLGGLLIARVLRRRGLHWSWAAAAAPCALVRLPMPGLAPATVAVAVICAVVLGRRWHREDITAGADLAREATQRRRPLETLELALRGLELSRRGRRGASTPLHHGQLLLGTDARGRPVRLPFGGAGGGEHALVVGATGSGKTVTQTWIAAQAIALGMGAIVIDPKGDRAMRGRLARAARAGGRRFIDWSPSGACAYNPYARGSDTEIADKVLAGERFTEPHYLRQAQRYVGHAVRAMRAGGIEVSLREIVAHLEPANLELLARELPGAEAQATHAYLDSLTARQTADLAGVRDRLAILAESDVGRRLDPAAERSGSFELLGAARARSVVYFNLEADRRPLLAEMLGAAIVQDLQTAIAALQGRPAPTLVVLDEFSALASDQVVRLFGRARSAGFSVLLGTQELSDLRLPGRERLLEQVLGNLSALVVHRQVVPSSAELVAGIAGSTGAWRSSLSSDGRTMRTRTSEPRLHPERVMTLERGQAAVLVLGAQRSARVARIHSPAD
jgi:Type IV secretion-system coupling protein DNA-binding domain